MSADGPIARSDRVDAMKFFAIALVVLGHVVALPRYDGALGELLYVIRSINMPMFMLLSGYVLFGREGTSPFRFVGRKFMALIVPYFSWVVFDLIRAGTPLSKWLAALVGAAVNPYAVAGRKWFLYVLFVFYVLFTLARAIGKQDAILVLMAVATIGLTFLPPGEYLGRFNIEWLFTFFVVGYLSCKYRGRMPSPRWWMAAAALLVYAGLLFIGNLPDGGSGWPPWYVAQSGGFFVLHWRLALPLFLLWKYATALAGIGAVALLYALTDKKLWQWQAPAGRHSLGIYVTQGWLLVLAVGRTPLAALESWLLVLYAALGVALLLEQNGVTRRLFLGRPARPRHSDSESPALT